MQTPPKHCAHCAPNAHTPPSNYNNTPEFTPNFPKGKYYDPPPLPFPPTARPRNPLIRLPFTLRSLSQFHPLPRPTSPSPLSISPPKPVPTLMKSHAAPNFRVKPLFYPEGTPTPLATPQTPKHSRDPFPPQLAPPDPAPPPKTIAIEIPRLTSPLAPQTAKNSGLASARRERI